MLEGPTLERPRKTLRQKGLRRKVRRQNGLPQKGLSCKVRIPIGFGAALPLTLLRRLQNSGDWME